MSEQTPAILSWLTQTLAVGGGLLMLAAALMLLVKQPVRRRMIGAIAARIALLVPLLALAPKWLLIPVEEPAPLAAVAPAEKQEQAPVAEGVQSTAHPGDVEIVFIPVVGEPTAPAPAVTPTPAAAPKAADPVPEPVPVQPKPIPWRESLLILYGVAASLFLARWLLAQLGLMWVIRRSRPAGPVLREMFARVAGGRSVPELRIVPNVIGPVCCGLWRPVVLLPQRLAETADEESLRWIFAHELAHLRRGDAWTAFWFGLAEALYFALPWFWWLKRQVRLCQEFVADAEAAGDTRAEDYASFLVNLSRSPRGGRRLAAASGVLGSPSELYRRIKMLLQDSKRVERSCPRRWSLLAFSGLLSLAVLLSGIGVARYVAAAPLDDQKPKEEKKAEKDQPKKDKDAKPEKEPEEKFAKPQKPPRIVIPQQVEGVDPAELQKQIEKAMEEFQKQFGQFGQNGFPNGPMVFPRVGGNFGNNPFFAGPQAGSGRLGVVTDKPTAALVEQLDLPKDQGLVLTEVKDDSPAAKAGFKANDILLEMNGKPVPSDTQEFRKQLSDIKADANVDAVVLRKGKRSKITGIKLPEDKAQAEGNNNPFGNHGNFQPFQFQPGQRNFRAIPVPALPNMPNVFEHVGPGNGKSTSITIANDVFSVHSQDEGLDITLGGKIEDGKTVVNQVKITDGSEKHNYDKLDNVPTKYREKVNGLLKSITVSK